MAKGNHITAHTQTLVTRVPHVIKDTYAAEADKQGVPVADLIREDLTRGLKRRGYVIAVKE